MSPAKSAIGGGAMSLLKIRRMSHTSTVSGVESELTRYLNQPALETDDDEPFDLLSWWRSQESRNPILTAMARDILTVPISTVASEAAFSAGGQLALDSGCKKVVVIDIDVHYGSVDELGDGDGFGYNLKIP
ncbi:hypothetical protein RHGRI_005106 [Rhododendron griersonianum]|uniref:HAT C-terminal dimerisation domain-containing protein n=1 Tax=Rhododendron griersonianum TaxID=479676 RepID=A0AAV6LC89_9ERIC|nr:hypothetical protein RHGRI_005106 [Rhododendron griersonianum]